MKNGHDSHCKVCRKELRQERKQYDPEKYREDVRRCSYLRWYGITINDYDRMFEVQKENVLSVAQQNHILAAM